MPATMPPDVQRPLVHLHQVAQQYPGLWPQLDRLRAARGQGLPQWPDWCFLPLAGTVAALTQGAPQPDLRPLGMQIGIVGALAAWRATQGIYRFDPTVFDAVWDTPLTGELPTALLYRLPEWCCYVPVEPSRCLVPGLEALHGFWVHLEWDANTHHTELRFVLDLAGDTLLPLPLHVQETGGIAGAFARTLEVSGEQLARAGEVEYATQVWQQSAGTARDLSPYLAPLVSLTLYLCSQAADLQEARGQTRRPTWPQPTKTKHGPRLFPPAQSTTWHVAYRLGAALRSAQQMSSQSQEPTEANTEDESPRQPPRAHIRRAHWHTYYVGEGSRTDRSKAQVRVRWLPPIPVGLPDALIPTIRPVMEGRRGRTLTTHRSKCRHPGPYEVFQEYLFSCFLHG
jgi:hypothetical protein